LKSLIKMSSYKLMWMKCQCSGRKFGEISQTRTDYNQDEEIRDTKFMKMQLSGLSVPKLKKLKRKSQKGKRLNDHNFGLGSIIRKGLPFFGPQIEISSDSSSGSSKFKGAPISSSESSSERSSEKSSESSSKDTPEGSKKGSSIRTSKRSSKRTSKKRRKRSSERSSSESKTISDILKEHIMECAEEGENPALHHKVTTPRKSFTKRSPQSKCETRIIERTFIRIFTSVEDVPKHDLTNQSNPISSKADDRIFTVPEDNQVGDQEMRSIDSQVAASSFAHMHDKFEHDKRKKAERIHFQPVESKIERTKKRAKDDEAINVRRRGPNVNNVVTIPCTRTLNHPVRAARRLEYIGKPGVRY